MFFSFYEKGVLYLLYFLVQFNIRQVIYLKLKYPQEGLSRVPINIALSSNIFDSSQQVSGNKEQL